jgi:hypothetical protein
MNTLRGTILLCVLLAAHSSVRAEPQYQRTQRVGYIQMLLEALRATDRTTLTNTRNYIYVIDRNRCRSAFTDLRTSCLLDAARRNCYQKRGGRKTRQTCRLVSDVIVTNKLGEKEFIDTQTKYRIMSAHKDYRQEIRNELWRRYAELVTEFSLSGFHRKDDGDLAAGIDGYCLQSVDPRGLSYQYCVAAMAWFIGTSEKRID